MRLTLGATEKCRHCLVVFPDFMTDAAVLRHIGECAEKKKEISETTELLIEAKAIVSRLTEHLKKLEEPNQ